MTRSWVISAWSVEPPVSRLEHCVPIALSEGLGRTGLGRAHDRTQVDAVAVGALVAIAEYRSDRREAGCGGARGLSTVDGP